MFVSFGRRVSTSIAIARNVLTSETASAPASSAARANDATSVTFGVSFGMTGSARDLAHGADDVVRARQAAAERDAPFLDVGAGDVQLERGDPLGVRQDPRQLDVLVDRRAADVDEDDGAPVAQLRQLLADEPVHADALQADGVEHPRRRLDDARRRMSLALRQEQPLHGDAAERRQIDDVGVLDAVAEAAAGGDQRVGERQGADGDGKIHSTRVSAPARPRRCAARRRPGRRCRSVMKCGVPVSVAGRARRSCSSRRGRSP